MCTQSKFHWSKTIWTLLLRSRQTWNKKTKHSELRYLKLKTLFLTNLCSGTRGPVAVPGDAIGLHCASAKLWQGPVQLLTCSIVRPGSSVQSNWEPRFQDKFLFVRFVRITDPDVWGRSCGNWCWVMQLCVCVCVCMRVCVCVQYNLWTIFFWIAQVDYGTVLAMWALLLQASVSDEVFSVWADDSVCPLLPLSYRRHELHKLSSFVEHCTNKRNLFHLKNVATHFISLEMAKKQDCEKFHSQVKGRSKLSLALSQTASSPPALHYWVSPCMKSHLQRWRTLRIKVKGINKLVNCGTHSQLFPISRE